MRRRYSPYRAALAAAQTPAGGSSPLAGPDGGGWTGAAGAAEADYLAGVREALQRPACVWAAFGPADQRLAWRWRRQGVLMKSVRQAILLASTLKSLSIRTWKSREPIASLRHFETSLQEIRDNPLPEGYWEHLERNLALCEEYWKTHPQEAPRRARRGGQAVCNGGSGTPVAGSPEDRENGPGSIA